MIANVDPWTSWGEAFSKLEMLLKDVITIGWRVSFFCDSHPWLCVSCKNLRRLVKYGMLYDRLFIYTRSGRYRWVRRNEGK